MPIIPLQLNQPVDQERVDIEAPAQEEQPQLSVDLSNTYASVPSSKATESRAKKIDLGMGVDSPGAGELYNQIQQGDEQRIRMQQAQTEYFKQQSQRLEVLRNFASNSDGPISDGDMATISQASLNVKAPITPGIVSEYQYSQAAMRDIYRGDMVKNVTDAWTQARPENMSIGWNLGVGVLARQEVFRTAYENAEQRYHEQSTGSWLGDTAKSMGLSTIGLDWLPQVGVIPGKSFYGTPSTIRDQQYQYLLTQPLPQLQNTLEAVTKGMNPGEALEFTKGLFDYTSSHGHSDDFWTIFNVASLFGSFGTNKFLAKGFTPKTPPPEILSEAEKTLLKRGFNTVNRDWSRPYFDEFGLISDIERETMQKMGKFPLDVEGLAKQAEDIATNTAAAGSSKWDVFLEQNHPELHRELTKEVNRKIVAIPGTMDSMIVPERPMSAYELNQTINSLQDKNQLSDRKMVGMLRSWNTVNTMTKDIVQTVAEDSPPKIEKILSAAGDTQGAARAAVSQAPTMTEDTFKESLHPFLRGDKFTEDAGSFSREATTRLYNYYTQAAARLWGALDTGLKVERLPEEALDKAFDATKQMMQDRLPPDMSNRVTGVTRNPATQFRGPTVTVTLARSDATPFTSWDSAFRAGVQDFKLGPNNFNVAQFGAGHYVTYTAPVDETTTAVSQMISKIASEQMKTPNNIFAQIKRMGFWWNTAAPYTLPTSNMEARDVITHGVTRLQAAAKTVATSIEKLKKDEKTNMLLLFDKDRAYEANDKIGRFANTLGEFENNYYAEFNRMPTEREAKAYFSFRLLNDMDYVTRNIGYVRDLERQGIQNVRVSDRAKHFTDSFLGKTVDELPPLGKSPAGVYIKDTNHDTYFRTSSVDPKLREYVDRGIKEGWLTAIQVANPLERPLSNFFKSGGDFINYVVVPNGAARFKNVDALSIPYHDGFHREYQATHYLKQAVISRSGGRYSYETDRTILGGMSSAEVQDWHTKITEATRLFKLGDKPALVDYLAKNLPEEHFSYEKFVKRFQGEHPWNLDEPFYVVPTGKTIQDVDPQGIASRYPKGLFFDEHNSPYNLMKDVDKRFLGSRDPNLWTIKEFGSDQQPLVKVDSAPMLDISRSLNRTVSSALHAHLVQDYKIKSAQQFIENFSGILDHDLDAMRLNPQYYLLNGKFISTAENAPLIATAKAARANILQFIGMDSPDVRAIKWLQNEMVNMVYKTAGQDASHFVRDNIVGGIKDPTVYARRIASHFNLGMFNPLQFLGQLNAVVHTVALSGVTGLKGSMAAIAAARLELTEDINIIRHYDGLLSKANVGWKPGWLEESHLGMKRAGWELVQGEGSWAAAVQDQNTVQSKWGKFVDAGYYFFRAGEKGSRLASWNTAYLEWREANPTAALTDKGLTKILARSRMLNNDMTRAASAPIEGGLAGVTTQFWQWQERLAGVLNPFDYSRMTPYEKIRAYGVYMAAYGIPIAATIPIAYWPINETIRSYALENDKAWEGTPYQALMEGLPSYLMSMATGGKWTGDAQHAYAERYSPGGIRAFKDFFYSDKGSGDVAKLLTGASGQKVHDIAKPIWGELWPAVQSVFGEEQRPFSFKFVEESLRTINVAEQAFRGYYAWQLKSYFTKDGRLVKDDIDKIDAAIMTTLGLTPRQVSDVFLDINALKTEKGAKDEAQKVINKEMRLATEALKNNDNDAYAAHIQRAKWMFNAAGYQPMEWSKVMSETYKELLPLVKGVDMDFKFRKAPPERAKRFFDSMSKDINN